jgi:hypothetical protein
MVHRQLIGMPFVGIDRETAMDNNDEPEVLFNAEDEHEDFIRYEVQLGIDAANAGDLISADEVEMDARRWRAAYESDG